MKTVKVYYIERYTSTNLCLQQYSNGNIKVNKERMYDTVNIRQ
jgi:hypothetical protein